MSLLNLNLPQVGTSHQDHQTLGNLIGHSDTLAISESAQQFNGLTVVVTPDTRTALRLEKSLPQFVNMPVQLFPIGKPCRMIISLHIKILSRLVYRLFSNCNKVINRFSCCQ